MPNWCVNSLSIEGSAKDLKRFKKKAHTEESDFSFAPFLPMPKELREVTVGFTTIDGKSVTHWIKKDGKDVAVNPKALQKKYGYTDWYERNCAVIGTKWDVDGSLEMDSRTELRYGFESAWAPPTVGVARISEMFPDLTFTLEYDEPGCDFAGEIVIKGGAVVRKEEFKSKIAQEFED